jgi:hypothetical protein
MGIFFALFQNLVYSEKQEPLTDNKIYFGDDLSITDAIDKQELLLFELSRYNFWTSDD